MNPITIKIRRLRDGATLPVYATEGSAACDLTSAEEEDVTLQPGQRRMIHTGLSIEPLSSNVVTILAGRSGLGAKHGITLANGIGVIDSDYRGEIQVALIHQGDTPYTIHPGDRIAQMFFLPVLHAAWIETETLSETNRSSGGFGSTGN